jgi:predicted nuclease of predicted toxin-antitoxin system
MKLLADQDVHFVTLQVLRGLGYDVVTVKELGLHRASDEEVLGKAVQRRRLLFTRDEGFSALKSSVGLLVAQE